MASETGPTAASPDPENRLPDGVSPRLLSELSRAMSEQADRFEPSHDAYRKLAEAVAGQTRPTAGRWL